MVGNQDLEDEEKKKRELWYSSKYTANVLHVPYSTTYYKSKEEIITDCNEIPVVALLLFG